MSGLTTEAQWRSPSRRGAAAVFAQEAQPLLLVAEESPVLAPMMQELGGFLRARAEAVAPAGLDAALRLHRPVGVLCHAPRTGPAVGAVLRAVVAEDPGLPVMVVTEHDPGREARLAVAAEIIRLDRLVWLEQLPDLRRLVDFLFLAERRAHQGRPGPGKPGQAKQQGPRTVLPA